MNSTSFSDHRRLDSSRSYTLRIFAYLIVCVRKSTLSSAPPVCGCVLTRRARCRYLFNQQPSPRNVSIRGGGLHEDGRGGSHEAPLSITPVLRRPSLSTPGADMEVVLT